MRSIRNLIYSLIDLHDAKIRSRPNEPRILSDTVVPVAKKKTVGSLHRQARLVRCV